MVTVRISNFNELELFVEMAAQPHANEFVGQNDLQSHQNNFLKKNYHYLTIEAEGKKIAGYFILVVDDENQVIEFGRICIDQAHLGIGQQAIHLMEQYCRENFNYKDIWLDVFEDNDRGRHIYEKIGYTYFQQTQLFGKTLLFYRKTL
jgi:RimJ/RimL family protein N-acetyltransferase